MKNKLVAIILFHLMGNIWAECEHRYKDGWQCVYKNLPSTPQNFYFQLPYKVLDYDNYYDDDSDNDPSYHLLIKSSNLHSLNSTSFKKFPTDNLASFHIDYCQINEIDSFTFENFKSLTYLNISHNNLKEIKMFTFKYLSLLQKLDISFNNITSLEHNKTFYGLISLQSLDLSNNHINKISNEIFTNLNTLTKINLSNNNITSIDQSVFANLNELNSIDLSHNQIKNISFLKNVTYLKEINLEGNLIFKYDIEVFKNPNFEKINLSSNKILNITLILFTDVLNKSKEINLNWNNIKELNIYSFQIESKTTYLSLSHNSIGNFSSGTFGKLIYLETLDISFNNLHEIGAGSFVGLQSVAKIYLNNNNIKVISKVAFHNTPKLEVLDIGNNLINTLDENYILRGTSLKFINFSNNTFEDCFKLISLIEYFRKQFVFVVRGEENRETSIHGIPCKEIEDEALENYNEKNHLSEYFEKGFKNSSFFKYFKNYNASTTNNNDYKDMMNVLKNMQDSLIAISSSSSSISPMNTIRNLMIILIVIILAIGVSISFIYYRFRNQIYERKNKIIDLDSML